MSKYFKLMAVLLAGLFWLMPSHAQENENIAMRVLITPKDGHDEALIKAITDYHHWMANFEGHMEFSWYAILTGPDTGKYIARSGGHKWADFDAEYDWQEEAGKVFETNVAPHIEDMDVMMVSMMDDMSHRPESWEGYTHFNVSDWYVKNGRYGEFRRGLKKIVETLKAGGYPNHWSFSSIESGGYGGQLTVVSPTKGWAGNSEADPSFYDIMSKELGGEDAFNEFMASWGDTFKPGANRTVKYMPEASDYGKD